VSETIAGIRRDAPNPQKKRAASLTVLREILPPIPDAPGQLLLRLLSRRPRPQRIPAAY